MFDIDHSFRRVSLAVLELVRLMISKYPSKRFAARARTSLVFDIYHSFNRMSLTVLELVRLTISIVSVLNGTAFSRALSHDIDILSLMTLRRLDLKST